MDGWLKEGEAQICKVVVVDMYDVHTYDVFAVSVCAYLCMFKLHCNSNEVVCLLALVILTSPQHRLPYTYIRSQKQP